MIIKILLIIYITYGGFMNGNICSASDSNGLYELYKEILKNDIKLIIEQFKIKDIEEHLEFVENRLKKSILQNILMRWSLEHPEDKEEIEEDMKNFYLYKSMVKDNNNVIENNRKKRKYLSKKNKRQINKKKKSYPNIPQPKLDLYKQNLELNHTVENDISPQIIRAESSWFSSHNGMNNNSSQSKNDTKSFLDQRDLLETSGIKNQSNKAIQNPFNETKTNTTTGTIRKNKFRERLEELMHKIEFKKLYMNRTYPSNTYKDKFLNNDKNSDSLSDREKQVKKKGDYMKIWLKGLRSVDFYEKPLKFLYISPKLETNEDYLNKNPYKYSFISKPDRGILVMETINFENIKNSSINIFNIDNTPKSKCSCCSQEKCCAKSGSRLSKENLFFKLISQ